MLFATSRAEITWLRFTDSLRNALGWALERLHIPAQIKEFEFIDPETNETIFLSTGRRYTVLHIGGKRFFFDRVTGILDGTCTSLQERVSNGLEL